MAIILVLTLLVLAAAFGGAIVMALRENDRREWRFELSRVLSDALAAIARAPAIFAGTALATTALPIAAGALLAGSDTPGAGSAYWSIFAAGGIGALLIGLIGQMAMTAAALDALEGRQPRVAAMLRSVLPLVPQGLVLTILWWIAVAIGLTFFFVPGVILMCVWFVPTAVLIAERRGVWAAFGRSRRLTKGARWQILLLLCIGAILWLAVQALLGALAAVMGDGVLGMAAYGAGSALMGVLPPAVSASAYRLLSRRKEGPRTEELERVFA